MRLDNIDSRALGELVAKVNMLYRIAEGDLTLTVKLNPATAQSSAKVVNKGSYKRKVYISLQDGKGNVFPYTGAIKTKVDKTSTSGNATVPATVGLIDGIGFVEVAYTGTWASADTCTLTVGDGDTFLGKAVTKATSVDTLGA